MDKTDELLLKIMGTFGELPWEISYSDLREVAEGTLREVRDALREMLSGQQSNHALRIACSWFDEDGRFEINSQ